MPLAFNRIMIVGQPGSGKSTVARRLGERTGLPVIYIDKIHWQSGWIERSKDETTRLSKEAEKGARWIFEGGHSSTWPSRLARADMLVWLDRPVGVRLWRILRRAFVGLGKTRPDMAEGCPERLRSLPEFVHYIWTTRHVGGGKIALLAEMTPEGCEMVRLCSDEEVDHFVARFPAA